MTRPIGIIDSGIGGLTVWKELVRLMPNEDYLYFGDSGFCPYGSKEPDQITRRVKRIVEFLIGKRCKIIVIACNAITASSIGILRRQYPIPFIGMEPAIKPALMRTRTRAIGVLATERTLKGRLFANTRGKYAKGIKIIEQIGEGLVEKVEALEFGSDSTRALLRRYLSPMMARQIDYLVLGCTHYPFLKKAIEEILGHDVEIIDPAPAVARHTSNSLKNLKLNAPSTLRTGENTFFTTGDRDKMKRVLSFIQSRDPEIHSVSL